MVHDWIMPKLESARAKPRLLVRDPLRLLPTKDPLLREFCEREGFALVMASTNLVFRQQYEWAITDDVARKILIVDQAPTQKADAGMHAPAPFYPDLLAKLDADASIDVDLREYLKFRTGDANWPALVNDRLYARYIRTSLDGVLRTHENLRRADANRFTDLDLQTIVAYAALDIPHAAFRTLVPDDYIRIGLFGLEKLNELHTLVPQITRPIRDALSNAPAPFRWFGTRAPETVVRAFYLCVLLAQHCDNWKLLAGNIDRGLGSVTEIDETQVLGGVASLVDLNASAAERDLGQLEDSLKREHLELFLVGEAHIGTPEGWARVLENERYSTLVRSLSLLLALDNRLANAPDMAAHMRVESVLMQGVETGVRCFVETRDSPSWTALRDIYLLSGCIAPLIQDASTSLRSLRPTATFTDFWEIWNGKKINRLEYYVSRLERLVGSGELLPASEDRLPTVFLEAYERIRNRVQIWRDEIDKTLGSLNVRFQEAVGRAYPGWVAQDSDVRLTAQFVRRCLKPNWDPQTEKAVLFIFDGMRYDIWEEMLRPILEERMELLEDYPASSILPSETHLTRKAISAGDYPDTFSRNAAEDRLLQAALSRELGYNVPITVLTPDTAGTGETVRYRAGNLDIVIFELCDKELHGISWKQLPNGKEVPARPLAFIYEQQIKNLLETEVRGILRILEPGTKVFVTADHGFGRVGRNPIWFDEYDQNEQGDVKYLNAMLIPKFADLNLPHAARNSLIGFRPDQLRMPAQETGIQRDGTSYQKQYGTIVFPKVGYALRRSKSPFNPDAYSHGGISLPELLIPMAVLRVKDRDTGLLTVGQIEGPLEVVEGEEAVFDLRVQRAANATSGELRIDVEGAYADNSSLPPMVLFLSDQEEVIEYRFRPDTTNASPQERQSGQMSRTLHLTVRWRESGHSMDRSRALRFTVRLTPEQIVRRVGNLGNVLGLTPRSRL